MHTHLTLLNFFNQIMMIKYNYTNPTPLVYQDDERKPVFPE